MARDPVVKLAALRVADRRLEARYDGSINGSYTLSSRRPTDEGGIVQVFACRTRSISPSRAAITAPVLGQKGELITVRFDGIGILRGEIEKHLEDGFVFAISASLEQRKKLAGKIDGLKKRRLTDGLEKRGYHRLLPADPRSAVTLGDGRVLTGFVIDFSRSGAAVSADHVPAIGARLVVGVLAARVVRYLEVGFSVQFEAVQEIEGLEALITGYEAKLLIGVAAPTAETVMPAAALAG